MAIVDDNYTMGHPYHIFLADQKLGNGLKKVGLQLQLSNSQSYISEEFRNEEWDQHQGNIPNRVLNDSDAETMITDGNPHCGIITCNISIGIQLFTQGHLDQKMKTITRGFNQMKELLDPVKWPHAEIPSW